MYSIYLSYKNIYTAFICHIKTYNSIYLSYKNIYIAFIYHIKTFKVYWVQKYFFRGVKYLRFFLLELIYRVLISLSDHLYIQQVHA